jgi:hypothetical protein
VVAVLVGGGCISRNDLIDPLGRPGQHAALHHLRNQNEAPLGELVDLLTGQHAINVEGRHPWRQRDFPVHANSPNQLP